MTFVDPHSMGVQPMNIGAPQPPARPSGLSDLLALNGRITAQAEVTGRMEPMNVTVTVGASSDLLAVVEKARSLVAQGALMQSHNGNSMPQAGPTRHD